jgi:hypothetical protein
MLKTVSIVAVAVLFVSGCGAEPPPVVPEQTTAEGSTALSNVEAADERAAEWNEDAELYAIAAATPQLDAGGTSPGWLYTYVSESAGAVATVSVEENTVGIDPEQELPEEDITFLSESALPEAGELLDSDEALEQAEEVSAVLESSPDTETAAGLDSVSGGEPMWRFSTIQDEERVEESVPAVGGGA